MVLKLIQLPSQIYRSFFSPQSKFLRGIPYFAEDSHKLYLLPNFAGPFSDCEFKFTFIDYWTRERQWPEVWGWGVARKTK